MTSVQERIKRLNEQNSEVKAPTSQHLGNVHNRVQSLSKPNVSTTLSKDKSHLFKTAKLIQKSFSSDSAEGDAPLFSSSSSKQQRRTREDETRNYIPRDDPNPIHASLSDDDEDGELDAAAAMSYWRNRGKGNNIDRKEAREHSSTTKITASNGANRTSAPVMKPVTKPAGEGQKFTSDNSQVEREPVVLPLSPPRLHHMQPPQSTFNPDCLRQPTKAEEEAPFDIVAAVSESPTSSTAKLQYAMSPTTAPILSVKSSESVLSGGTETSCASTLSTRAKKFLKEKRKNGPILTGRGGVNGNADGAGAEMNRSKAKSILRERAAKDMLQKKTAATMATNAPPIAVETDDLGQYSIMGSISNVGKRDELGEDITQIKADSPFDEPSKMSNTMESTVSSDQLRNFAFASIDKVKKNHRDNASQQSGSTKDSTQKSDIDIIRVTQQGRPAYVEYDGSVSEYTNQSEMNSTINNDSVISNDASQLTSKGSLPSNRDRRTHAQRKNQPKSVPINEEGDFLEVMGSAAFDAGCQVLDSAGCNVLEAFESLADAFIGTEDEKVKANDVPFDEDVAIEVEYVDQKRSPKSARDKCTVNVDRR